MSTVQADARPNIRIEIQNNLTEAMDVDGSEHEEGEIQDGIEDDNLKTAQTKPSSRTWNNVDGGFTTGIDIFDKKEQEKLHERAQRFGLKPDEVTNFTDDQLQGLYDSLGITIEGEKDIRFEAIHILGTEEMSTEDVFEYFGKYGPAFIEWINDESCNVVWNDKVSAARALHFVSSTIEGMPVEGPCDPFTREVELEVEKQPKESETEAKETGRSILLKNENRDVEFSKDDESMLDPSENKENKSDKIHLSNITRPIPPGFWRLGLKHPKAGFLLMRFAFKNDKKPLKAERFSEYYKKYGNPNFGGMRGIISKSRRRKAQGIFDHNKEINNKDPWGDLANTWDEDINLRERYGPITVSDSPPRRQILVAKKKKSDVLNRLGIKRPIQPVKDEPQDEAEEVQEETESTIKKSKVPRMRMYADEEEEKIKRKRQLQMLKTINMHLTQKVAPPQPPVEPDLRNVIGSTIKRKDIEVVPEEIDLGTKLKNRLPRERVYLREEPKQTRHRIERPPSPRREKPRAHTSVLLRKESETVHSSRERRRSPRRRSAETRHRTSHHENKFRSDHYRHRRSSYSDEEYSGSHKPKSKVAVVIKTQKKPAVASTIWSRINIKKERLKTRSEKVANRKTPSSSSESSSESSNSSTDSQSSSSDSSSDSEESDDNNTSKQAAKSAGRPGFETSYKGKTHLANKPKSPLRIEIANDHFKEE